MVTRDPNVEREHTEREDDDGIDLEGVRDITQFVLRAPRRHLKLALAAFVAFASLGLAVAMVMPRVYNSQTRLLAQSSTLLRALSGSNPETTKADNPIGNAADTITRYDNLVALVKQAGLVERFFETRPPALRFKDKVMSWLSGSSRQLSDEDKIRMLVGVLENRLVVFTDGATLTLSADWGDPKTAYDLVILVQKNFLEARYDSDVAAITDSITVLQDHADKELAKVDAALGDYEALMADRVQRAGAARAQPAPVYLPQGQAAGPAPATSPAADPDLAMALEEKRRQVRMMEEDRQHMIDAARQQLLQAQVTLTPMHPTVIALQQRLDALNQPSPELLKMKEEERALMAQIAPAAPVAPAAPSTPGAWATQVPRGIAAPPPPVVLASNEDGKVQLAREKLADAIAGYRGVMSRLDGANVELEITRAAYKHRFTVLSPAEIAVAPKKQTPRLIALGALLGGALLALALSVMADMATGRILEAWQIRRLLKVDVLGDLDVVQGASLDANRSP